MWRKTAWILTAGAVLLLCGNARANPITADGDPLDWLGNLNYGGSAAAQLAAINSAANHAGTTVWEPVVNPAAAQYGDGTTSPGGGGQNFDVEAVYANYYNGVVDGVGATDGLNLGIFTGFDVTGETYGVQFYTPGDVFFDFGSDGTYELAVETNAALTGGGSALAITGHAYGPPSVTSPWYSLSSAFPTLSGPEEINYASTPTDYGAVGFGYSNDAGETNGGADDHNFIEVYLSEAFLLWGRQNYGWDLSNVNVNMHWTMSCGNDFEDIVVGIPPDVPEPATMVMLGCLGAGMFVTRKVRRKKG